MRSRTLLLLATPLLCPLMLAADSLEHDLNQEDVQQRFAKTLSVDFKKQPLDAVLSLFMEFTKTTILTDPALTKQKLPPVTFSAEDAPIFESFTRALAAVGADWAVFDNAIFVYRKGAYGGDPARLTRPLSAAETQAFAKAVADLRDEALATRDEASKSIEAFGTRARPLIAAALEAEKDPEAIDRLKTLLAAVSVPSLLEPLPADVVKELESRTEIVNAWYSDGLVNCITALNETAHAKVTVLEAQAEINLRVMQMPVRSVLVWAARYTGTKLAVRAGRMLLVSKQE